MKPVKILDPGHDYELAVLDGHEPVHLRFVKREGPGYPGNVDHYSGTTMQYVLRALIDRAGYVNRQIPCWQTTLARHLMMLAVWLLEHRAAKRHKRSAPGLTEAVQGDTCSECGHVGCRTT